MYEKENEFLHLFQFKGWSSGEWIVWQTDGEEENSESNISFMTYRSSRDTNSNSRPKLDHA